MSDRLKYRAWDKKYKYMNYKVCIGNVDPDAGENWTAHTVWIEPDKVDYKCDPHWMAVDQYTDMVFLQCTGLKDRNGKIIYDGDILCYGSEEEFKEGISDRMLVYHDDDYARFGLKFYSIYGGEGYTGLTQHIHQYVIGCVCIGNIYENPELLK